MQSTILVVEDEQDILDLVEYNLHQAGYGVETALTGQNALDRINRNRPDMIILDLMLPGIDGKEICRRVRQDENTRDIPVIMLTARAEEVDRIVGFELGADDYLTKPFSPRELVLRVNAIMRRSKAKPEAPTIMRFAGLTIDPERHQVQVEGLEVTLTATEFKLLTHLAARTGRVQTREMLLDEVWGYPYEGYARTVDTHIRRLRKKLGPLKDRIETIRGVGYRFCEEK